MSATLLLVLRLGLVGVLYAFLGYALWILWQDLRQQSRYVLQLQAPALTLLEQGQDGSKSYSFTSPEVNIGRDSSCDCCLDDPTVSARHARLTYHHSQWWVKDLNSRNGTFLNQEPVPEAVVVTSGDELRCGQVVFQILLGEQALEPENDL
jgi:pSer/pThr/pTyr-binding forkhead associated (FHA) protein